MNVIEHSLKDAFGIDAPISYEGYDDPSHPNVPSKIENYHFRRDLLRDVLAFLKRPRGDALYITGPTGSGKTSLTDQIASRLSYPVQEVTASEGLTFLDLLGQYVLKSNAPGETPAMVWQDGPLTTAARNGHLFVLNEGDLMDPAEMSGFNEILSGKPVVLVQNGGEVIKLHKMFRVIVTGNSNGSGDASGLYQGVLQQNIAAMDRYRLLEVSYMQKDDEIKLLSDTFPELELSIIKPMVDVANHIRRIFVGADPVATLSVTMSTRTLSRWAGLALDFCDAEKPLKYSLERALLVRANAEEKEAIDQVCSSVFGVKAWNQ